MPLTVEIAAEASDELVDAFARLMPQLSPSARVPDRAALAAVIASPSAALFVARDDRGDQPIVGVGTLVAVPIPTRVRAIIEDVVVDEAVRGRGAGEALVRAMLAEAARRGATTVELTSHPGRVAANRLYQRLGFTLRTTNPYRLEL